MKIAKGYALFFALVIIATLSGCSNNGNGADDIENPKFKEVTVDYGGRSLTCLAWDGSNGEVGMTCDFTEYWQSR